MRLTVLLFALMMSGCMFFRPQAETPDNPVPDEVTDSYHGETIRDPFRWMEDVYSKEVQQWISEQNGKAETYFGSVSFMGKLKDRVIAIAKAGTASYDTPMWRGGKLFALKTQPPLNQPLLVVMPSAFNPASELVVFDPNLSDAAGGLSIDWYVPSPDGRLVALSLSKQGTEVGDLYVFEVATPPTAAPAPVPGAPPVAPQQKEPIEPVIPEVHRATAGGALEWTPDSKGFYYTRYPRAGERIEIEMPFYQQLYYHRLGDNAFSDQYELGKNLDRAVQFDIEVDPRSGRVLATLQEGDSGRFAHFLKEPGAKWRQLTKFEDQIVNIVFSPKGGLFVLSRDDAPRGRILYLASTKVPVSRAKKILEAAKESIVPQFQRSRTLLVTKSKLYLTYQLGDRTELRVFSHQAEPTEGPAIRAMTGIGEWIVPIDEDEILFSASGCTEPKAWYYFDGRFGTDSTEKTGISTGYAIDFSDAVATTVTVTSNDGAEVPLHLFHRKDLVKNSGNPVILVGDGGFGRSLTPTFDPMARLWLDHGGVLAYAGIRGGGELGEDWHRAGMLTHKQKSFDDFEACAKYLIDGGFTSSTKLAMMGKGNGGLLMGAMIVQHPLLMKAAVARSGIFDMIRLSTTPNGEVMIPEYGLVKDKSQFEAMFAYSPYHRIKRRVDSPSVLFLNGINDNTVAPFHSRKMAARLQQASRSTNPIIIKTNPNTGYGADTPYMQQLAETAEIYAFIFRELGVQFKK